MKPVAATRKLFILLVMALLVVAALPEAGFAETPSRTTITAPGLTLEITGDDTKVDAVLTTNPVHEYPVLQIAMGLIAVALLLLLIAWLLHRNRDRTLEPNPSFPSNAPAGAENRPDAL